MLNYQSIKYLKLVNHTASKRTKWSYEENCQLGMSFYLHWAFNEDDKSNMNRVAIDKARNRKKQDANKPEKGNQIILCQNNVFSGHRITHVVEVVSDQAEEKNDDIWARYVRVTWVARIPWENYTPLTKNVIGDKFSFNSGYLVTIHSPSIKLDLNILDS